MRPIVGQKFQFAGFKVRTSKNPEISSISAVFAFKQYDIEDLRGAQKAFRDAAGLPPRKLLAGGLSLTAQERFDENLINGETDIYSMPIEDIAKAVVGTERYVQSDYSAFVPIVLDFGKEKLDKVLNQVSKIDLPATDSTTEYFIPSNGGKIQVNNWTEPSKEELVKAAEEITLEIPRSKTPRAKFKIDID